MAVPAGQRNTLGLPIAEYIKSPRHAAAASACAALFLCALVWKLSSGGGQQIVAPAKSFAQPRLEGWWQAAASQLKAEVAAVEADYSAAWDVVFLGDSIMEALRGTEGGGTCDGCLESQEVFQRHMGSQYRAGILAIAGDQTAHLLFRITHGGLPKHHPPRLVVLMIGTNDLGYTARMGGGEAELLQAAEGVVQRVETIVQQLLFDLPNAQVALLALLPRGDRSDYDAYALPNMFTPALERVNSGLRDIAGRTGRVQFVDCAGPLLLIPDGTSSRIDENLMPDALHPSAAGYEAAFSGCWDTAIARLV